MEKLFQPYATNLTRFAKAGAYMLAFSFFALPGNVLAQADTAKNLKEVKVKATPIPQIHTLIPTQQVTSADFARYNALTVADAIRDFAGVNIKDYGGIGGLKTVSVRGLSANHLAVFFDGIQLSDAQNGQIDLGKLMLSNVQSITLYNGMPPQICQTARAFASASVLSITTFNPKLDSIKPYQVMLGINGGSFGLVEPYGQWQQRINKTWSFTLNGYLERANGKYKYKVDGDGSDTLATRTNGDVNTHQTDATIYWTKNDSNKLKIHIDYNNSDRGLPGAVIFYNPYSASREQTQNVFAQADYERMWTNTFHLLINSKYSQDYLRYTDPSYQNGAGGIDQHYTQREFYQSATLAYNLTKNWELSYAIDAAYAKLDADLPNYLYPNRFSLLNVLATNFKIGKWILQANILATQINERISRGAAAPPVSKLSPTVVVNYRVNQNLQLRAYYKDIFRVPTFNEQYFFAVVQTRDIKPEYTKQVDAGFTYSKALTGVFSYVALTVDGYYNRITNKIITLPNQNLAISSVLNFGRADVTGTDIGLKTEATLTNKWKAVFLGNYTYQQALDVTNPDAPSRIPYSPQHSLAVNAGVYNEHWGFYYNQLYSSSRYYISDNSSQYRIPGYAIGDVSAVYNFLLGTKAVNLSAGLNNVFDVNYSVVRSFPMPSRSVKLSMQITI